MDSWPQATQDVPGLLDSSVPYNPDDWEDWLRWDPTVETFSPEHSSKDSNDSPTQDATNKGDQFPWLVTDDMMAPPLIVGDDASMLDMSIPFGEPSLDFGLQDQSGTDPFVFNGNKSLQPVADHLQLSSNVNEEGMWLNTESQNQQPLAANPHHSQDDSRRTSQSNSAKGAALASQSSPESATRTHSTFSSSQSPQPVAAPAKKKSGRKRKADADNSDGSGDQPIKKTSHNVIEKRYRNNLNDKILELRDSVPSLRAMSRPDGTDGSEDLEGLTPAHKLNKSTVMAKATEYIKHLEKRNKTLSDDMDELKARMTAMEKAYARNSAMQGRQANVAGGSLGARSRQGSVHTPQMPSTGQASVMQVPQQQYLQQHATPTYEPQASAEGQQRPIVNQRGNGMMGKLMVGSMAGLMVMEGFHEHEQDGQGTASRGLFAAPIHMLKRSGFITSTSSASTQQATLSMLKMVLLFGALLYLISPLLTRKPRRKPQSTPRISLTKAESLASPVETRRKAWLTAIQSVWTPRPFLLEVVAVTVRMVELSLRRLIGFDRYSEILGMTKDDEAARIKAWDIAIDAQLAGGDAEVSYYRLLLTIMASGTLPDSPIRLMQKAVHFRIFFWEIANAGYGNLFMFKDFTAKVAKIYWNSARNQHKALASDKASQQDDVDDKIDLLPDHLAALIELDCDEVLTDSMIQRAYNLAWNRPSSENTFPSATLDRVVEDHAVRSPLDAVAGWFTNTIIDEALVMSLDPDNKAKSDFQFLVDLSSKTAPPASATQCRALVARAVLLDEGREANITAALATMPSATSNSPTVAKSASMPMNVVDHAPLTPDIRTALTLAKLLSIASLNNPKGSQIHAASALGHVVIAPANLTLLTAVAAHKVISVFSQNALLFGFASKGLDGMAGSLRVWVGSRAAKSTGLKRAEKRLIVNECLAVTRKTGGWKSGEEIDSGYGSGGQSRRGSDGTLAA